MSLIPCTDDCLFQKDGCCNLQRAASSGTAAAPDSGMASSLSAGSSEHYGSSGRQRCVHYTRRSR